VQTTLRIDDQLYRAAKTEAAREGVSLTRFLEEGIRLRLAKEHPSPAVPHVFRTYQPGRPAGLSEEEILKTAGNEQEAHDRAKLGLSAD